MLFLAVRYYRIDRADFGALAAINAFGGYNIRESHFDRFNRAYRLTGSA
jgi:hypothetical protein